MKQDIVKEVTIPQGVEAELNDSVLIVKGPKGAISREFRQPKVEVRKEGDKITVSSKKATRRERKMIGTTAAHIRNMIKGVVEGFEYKLQVCSVHFPITVQVDKPSNSVIIKNFLGETHERRAKILEGVEVKVEKDIIIVTSAGKEAAGQTALNIENVTRVRARDRRIFQDGIFMIEKCGDKII